LRSKKPLSGEHKGESQQEIAEIDLLSFIHDQKSEMVMTSIAVLA
jgi:hypothetical protein